jgi:hypothetical protein
MFDCVHTLPTFQQILDLDRADELQDRGPPYGLCLACSHNEKFSVTLALWRNEYGRCYEVGLRELSTDNFEFNLQSSFKACYVRFIRLAKLIEAGRDVSKFFCYYRSDI